MVALIEEKRKIRKYKVKDVCMCQSKSINDGIYFVFMHLSLSILFFGDPNG